MNIRSTLTGGKPNSLGRTDEVIHYVLINSDKLDELFDCVFDKDELVRLRAGDALEKICRQHPDWLTPYVERLFTEVVAIDQPSVQWHLVQMIGELELTEAQRETALKILRYNLEYATDWIVLNYTMEVFGLFVKEDETLKPYFIKQLNKHQKDPRGSVSKRATKYLEKFS